MSLLTAPARKRPREEASHAHTHTHTHSHTHAGAAAAASSAGGAAAGAAGSSAENVVANKQRILRAMASLGDNATVPAERLRECVNRDGGTHLTLMDVVEGINILYSEHRLEIFTTLLGDGSDLISCRLIREDKAVKLTGLDPEAQAVLAIVEKGGDMGVWVRNIKLSTKLHQTALNKILKKLETRKLIKPVKSVAHKNRRMYMLYELEPSKELTGGVWYNEQNLDLQLIENVSQTVLSIMKEKGGSASPTDVAKELAAKGVIAISLKATDVQQIMDKLVYEGKIDYVDAGKLRTVAFTRANHAIFPTKKSLLETKRASDGKRGATAKGEDEAEGDDEEEEAEGEDELKRVYRLVNYRPMRYSFLTSVPCGTCPVEKSCVPGGIISPETCIYFSHWLQW